MDDDRDIKDVSELSPEQLRGVAASLQARLEGLPQPNTGLTFRNGDQAFFFTRRPLGLWQRACLWCGRIRYTRNRGA